MKQANQLRTGNYVMYGGEYRNISGVDDNDERGSYVRFSGLHYGVWIEEVRPIPLTEEILLKCGFTLRGIIFRINNGLSHQFDINYSLSRDMFYYDSSKYGMYTEVEIKYLHQLQNLYFALCGEELEVKL